MKAVATIGRLIFGGFFLYNGINHILKRQAMVQYAGAKRVPEPELAITASTLFLLLGGASVLLGYKPKLGAMPLAGFLGVVSPMMHDFWNAGPEAKQNEMIHFSKNIALLGAALMLMGEEK